MKPSESQNLTDVKTYINQWSDDIDGDMSDADSPIKEMDPAELKRTFTRMKKQREYNEKKHMDALYNLFPSEEKPDILFNGMSDWESFSRKMNGPFF